ncbi:MAG: phenylacetic acid degradation protein [Meiothermus sp.]|uniref:phenylacetic acid degradation protein n=1 Tax=Meiothermus sp. TaxID=1955249 RepID=UPI0025F22B28|nr:phenylacetic acid degradation protein [Meiothermus sp.]MCS7069830.1 phenylacetic acid degradation protein [Meiothermus sp.]
MDTQWPRWEVFKQDDPQQPHRSIGTVHAPDAEMALLIARDVHVRRPDCASLWVARADCITALTAEEIAADPNWHVEDIPPDAPTQRYLIFQKTSQRRAMTFVAHMGDVEARSPREALRLAMERFGTNKVFVWWAVPAGAITRSEAGVEASWFAPAREKKYKQQSEYGDVGGLRAKVRRNL